METESFYHRRSKRTQLDQTEFVGLIVPDAATVQHRLVDVSD